MPKSSFTLLQVAATGLVVMISFSSLRVKSDDYELQATVQTPDIAFESETDVSLWARFHFAIHTEDFENCHEVLSVRTVVKKAIEKLNAIRVISSDIFQFFWSL